MFQQPGHFLLVILFALTGLVACSGEENTTDTRAAPELPPSVEPIRPAFDVVGTYKGEIPCASCPGIRSTVIFTDDGRVEKTDLYRDKDERSYSVSGTWEMATNNKIRVSFPDQVVYYALLSDQEIELLGPNDTRSELASGLDYKLQKEPKIEQPSELIGTYILKMEGGYTQQLVISDAGNRQFLVTISSHPIVPTGCSFSAKGKFVNNRIEVNLSAVESSLKGTMTIDITGDSARVFTATESQRYDLIFFCSGGTSLAGYYLKQ